MADSLYARFGREFPAGTILFREGERGEEMFVVRSGLVQVTKKLGDVDRPIATFGRGEFVGEMAILNDRPRTATAAVVEDAVCLVIDGRTLESMITKNPEIALRLIKRLARRLDSADELIQLLANPDPRLRVLLALKRHAEAFGEEVGGGVVLTHVNVRDLAREVGTDDAFAEEVLSRLARLRIAQRDESGNIAIADIERLLEFLEFVEMPRKFEAS